MTKRTEQDHQTKLANQPEPSAPPVFNAKQRRELVQGIARMERDQTKPDQQAKD